MAIIPNDVIPPGLTKEFIENWRVNRSRAVDDVPADPADEEPKDDIVRRPAHYTRYAIEPIEFIMRNGLRFEIGNIVKYACRAGFKLYPGKDEIESEITDLEKVRRYAEMRINQLKGKGVL